MSQSPQRIYFLSQWFEPEKVARGLEMVKALKRSGLDVEVVTGFPNYPTGQIFPGYELRPYQKDTMDGVVVHRLGLYPSHDRSSVARILNYLSFMVTSLVFLFRRRAEYSLIHAYCSPVTVGLAALIVSRTLGKRYLADVQDLWPESVGMSGMSGSGPIADAIRPICNWVYRGADLALCQSRGMQEVLVGRGVRPEKTKVLYNWANESLIGERDDRASGDIPQPEAVHFLYAGNMGPAQNLEPVVIAASELIKQHPNVTLTLIGGGVEWDGLQKLILKLASPGISILSAVPQKEVVGILNGADVLVIHLKDAPLFSFTIPSKVQFYMAVGKPILAGLNGEARGIVVEAGAGIAAAPGDATSLEEAMRRFVSLSSGERATMGERARQAYGKLFSFDAAMSELSVILAGSLDTACGRH